MRRSKEEVARLRAISKSYHEDAIILMMDEFEKMVNELDQENQTEEKAVIVQVFDSEQATIDCFPLPPKSNQ